MAGAAAVAAALALTTSAAATWNLAGASTADAASHVPNPSPEPAAGTPPPPGSSAASPAALPAPVLVLPAAPALPPDPNRWPVVPRIDPAMKARLREVYLAGVAMGNRQDVFIKVGDSISESMSYLSPIGCGDEHLAGHGDLAPVIAFFRRVSFPPEYTSAWCQVANSFDRDSVTAVTGWSASDALAPLPDPPDPACAEPPFATPLGCELHLLRPSVALVMYGTNDAQRGDTPGTYRANMARIARAILAAGVIPVLSTIPPRPFDPDLDARVDELNRAVIQVAAAQRVPLVNYWRALTQPTMVNDGIGSDGIHPNLYGGCTPHCDATDFSEEGLRYGYNQRNLTALETLAKILDVVIDDGPADVAPLYPGRP